MFYKVRPLKNRQLLKGITLDGIDKITLNLFMTIRSPFSYRKHFSWSFH